MSNALLTTGPAIVATLVVNLGKEQTMAQAATEHRDLREALEHYRKLSGQLQHALHSRLVIEQAKGVLAERYQLGFDEAFDLLRSFCRSHNVKIADAARALTTRNRD